MKTYPFSALLGRMKYITRWSLMRSGRAESRHYRYLADVVTRLPADTAWDPIKQPLQAMVYTTHAGQFYRWRDTLTQLFEDGV